MILNGFVYAIKYGNCYHMTVTNLRNMMRL